MGTIAEGNYSQLAIFHMKNHPVQQHPCIETSDNTMVVCVSL